MSFPSVRIEAKPPAPLPPAIQGNLAMYVCMKRINRIICHQINFSHLSFEEAIRKEKNLDPYFTVM